MQPQTKTDNRPQPPEHLADEALIEWERVCDELAANGTLMKTDRAILIVYCETWATYVKATQGVVRFGPVIKYPNGITAPSPFYKVQSETANKLKGLLRELGLTPASRIGAAGEADKGDLVF